MSEISNPERYSDFLRRYASSEAALHSFVRSLVPSRQIAAEVMQDVIVVLWQKFEEALDFQGWAFGVAKNVALHHLRRRSRVQNHFFFIFFTWKIPGLCTLLSRSKLTLGATGRA